MKLARPTALQAIGLTLTALLAMGGAALSAATLMIQAPAAEQAGPVTTPPATTPPLTEPPTPAPRVSPRLVTAEVIARYPHDQRAFTQGLIVDGRTLYEGTGREGQSEIRRVDLVSGRVLRRTSLPRGQFGEGMARWQGELISLTWTDGIAHRWDGTTLRHRGTLTYAGEGWGLAATDTGLVMSNGSADLVFRDPVTFAEQRRITVMIGERPLRNLNELEVVDGRIFANIWTTGFIAVIDPATGTVTHVIDLRAIVAEIGLTDPDAVLNGIAWDPAARRLFVTGKLWPTLFEIRLPPLD